MNILLPILRHSRACPDRVALIADGGVVTYGQLERVTALVAARLVKAGIGKGDVVALSIAGSASYVLVALGLARLGAVVSPFLTTWASGQATAILERHQVRALVRDALEEWRHPLLAEDRYLLARDLLVAPVAGETLVAPPVAMDVGPSPWILSLSSGTTGTPKSIPHTHERTVLNACLSGTIGGGEVERALIFSSPHISMAMNAILCHLVMGSTVILCTRRTPDQFFELVQRERPTHVVTSTGAATHLVAYAAHALPGSLAMCESVRSITISGGPASPSLCAAIQQRICARLMINYGGSEVGRMAVGTPETLASHPASVGQLVPWVEMEAVNETGQPLPPGTPGVLRVKSPLQVDGYLDDAEATARAFRDGWYYPGDTGHVDAGGHLTLTGRVDELLNVGGDKIDPFVIEAVLDAQPGVRESAAVVVTTPQGVAMLVAVVVADPFDEKALKRQCLQRLGRRYVPLHIQRVNAVPRNEAGKILRKQIAERLLAQASRPKAQEA